VHEFKNGEEQTLPYGHLAHCFDALRRQIICDADDTPRPAAHGVDGKSGLGQFRQCKDWSKLEKWSREHTACYKRPEKPQGVPNIEKYKFCPEGSGYITPDVSPEWKSRFIFG
jgi:hypothetical protein